MKLSPLAMRWLKILVALLGAYGLHSILKDFGYQRAIDDIGSLGPSFVPIFLSFLIPFALLNLAWWMLVAEKKISFSYLFSVSLVAMAWNNIGPVAKSLGEPTRVLLLKDRLSTRAAVRSMMLFNLAQTMGTSWAFGFGALLMPLFVPISGTILHVVLIAAALCLTVNGLLVFWMFQKTGRLGPTKKRKLRPLRHWWRWTSHQLRKYTRNHPFRYLASVGFAGCARLSEGAIFYVIFSALGNPLSLIESIAIDVGRGIADNVFFFVPYQLGTREYTLTFMTESVLGKGQDVSVSASLVFRLGELGWVVSGFLLGLWMLRKVDR